MDPCFVPSGEPCSMYSVRSTVLITLTVTREKLLVYCGT